MKLNQVLLLFSSFVGFFVKVLMSCAVLDFFISEIGAANLAFYYSASAALTFLVSMLLLSFAERLCPIYTFLTVHSLLLMIGIYCLILPDPDLKAKISFVSIMGTNIVVYFSMWSLASYLISPFQSKRLFPWVSTVAQFGAFGGALLAACSGVLNLEIGFFLLLWVGLECFQVLQGCLLLVLENREKSKLAWKEKPAQEKKNSEKRGLVSIIKEYRLPRRLSLFTFLYSLLWFVAMSLVATKFEESEYNLTSLYGSLDVASAILTTASAAFLYPRICNKIGLGRIYLVTCFAFSGFTFLYLGFPTLTVGILIYVGYRLIDGSIHSIALANQLTLYPGGERDQIRLMSDILAQSAGFFMVGFLFLLPGKILLVGICVVVIAFVCLGISASKKFDADILFFLRSSDHELKSNAIALFDQFDSEEYFNELRRIIKGDQPVDLKIEVIEILGKAIHPEGLPIVLDIIDDDSYCLPVKIAALSYLGKIKTTHVDPFQKFRMTEALRNIQMGRCAHSKVLKAYAIKNLMTHNPNEETFQLLRQSLLDKDTRVVANAIEGLGYLNYLGVYSILLPFLERPEGRVRANTCIALWKYMRLRPQVNVVITEMLESDDAGIVASGVFAVGEIRDTTRIETLKNLLNSGHQTEELLRGLPIALAKLSCAVSIGRLIDMILGEDEGRALSVAYLALGLDSKILNEDIIANIYSRGPEARSLGWKRFSECGAFCHEQLDLLGGAVTETHHFALS